MNWVAPIKDEITLTKYEQELRAINEKYYIMFEIGVGTGMQVQNLLQLTVGDVKEKDRLVVYLGTKRVRRSFHFPPELKQSIEEYTRDKKNDAPLFCGHKDNPISREQAYRALKEAGTRVGMSTIGAQTMRKTFAWRYYKNTGDIYYLTNLFNHASPSVTFRYIGEKPAVDAVMTKMTPEENMRARKALFEGGAGITRMEYIKDMMNLLEDEMENPANSDSYYGRIDVLLSKIEDEIKDFLMIKKE